MEKDFNPWLPPPRGATPAETIEHNKKCIKELSGLPDQSAGILIGCLERQNIRLQTQIKEGKK